MSRANLARLGLLAMIWGSSFLLIKVALGGLSPTQIVLWRLATGAVVLLAIVAGRREPLPRDPRLWAHLAVMGVVANIIPFFLFGWAELRITSGMAGVLNGTTPLFTLLIAAAAVVDEHLSRQRVGGLVLGFAGVVLVAGPWQADGTNLLSGQMASLGAAACYGVGFVYSRRFILNRGFRPLALSACQLSIAALLLGLVAPVVARQPVALALPVVASATLLGAAGTGLAYLLAYRLIAEAGPTSASMVTYLIPVVAVVLGIVVLGEPVGWNLFVGTAVVVAGVSLAEGRLRLGPTVDAPVVPPQQRTRW
ncbi:MAG: DMT family transporter [Egibacteraceae bacterium]